MVSVFFALLNFHSKSEANSIEKGLQASQPTLSRFFNRMDDTTLRQFYDIMRKLRKVVYAIKRPQMLLLDLDSTLLDTYGHQEGEGFNFHYQSHGYHPLVCYDGSFPKIHFILCSSSTFKNIQFFRLQ